MDERKPPAVGFWSSLGSLPPKSYALEVLVTLLIGVPGASYILANSVADERHDIAYDYLFVAAPLLGLVFAAFVLVVSLFSDSYVRALAGSSENGMASFLRPFVVAIGLQLAAVLTCVAYRSVATVAPSKVEVGLFVACTLLFLFAVFDVLAVTRTVAKHGLTRALAVEIDDLERRQHADEVGQTVPFKRNRR